jgi:hypothetical protein
MHLLLYLTLAWANAYRHLSLPTTVGGIWGDFHCKRVKPREDLPPPNAACPKVTQRLFTAVLSGQLTPTTPRRVIFILKH